MLLRLHGGEQKGGASAVDVLTSIATGDVTDNLCGATEVEKDEANGRHIIEVEHVAIFSPIVKFFVGIATHLRFGFVHLIQTQQKTASPNSKSF